jgi:hypothetical protein
VLGSSGITNGSFADTNIISQAGTYSVLIAPGRTASGSVTVKLIDVPPSAGAHNFRTLGSNDRKPREVYEQHVLGYGA